MAKKQVAVSLRKPPSPEKLDAFVAGGPDKTIESGAPAPRHSDIREIRQDEERAADELASERAPQTAASAPVEPAPAAARGPLVDAEGRPLHAVTVYLPSSLAERLTLHCIEIDRELSNFVGEAIEQHLQKRLGSGAWTQGGSQGVQGGASAPADAIPPGSRYSSGAGRGREGPFEDWFRGGDGFLDGGRIERLLQAGRLLVALWRKRPWVV